MFLKYFKVALPITSLLLVSFNNFQPANASIACQPKTASNYSNNSLAECILSSDTTFQIGVNTFNCSRGDFVRFDDKGQFQSCVLRENLTIRKGNEITNCPVGSIVTLSIASNGIHTIDCRVGTAIRGVSKGSCECPYDLDTAGNKCGNRSAWSRPSGTKPMCYVRS